MKKTLQIKFIAVKAIAMLLLFFTYQNLNAQNTYRKSWGLGGGWTSSVIFSTSVDNFNGDSYLMGGHRDSSSVPFGFINKLRSTNHIMDFRNVYNKYSKINSVLGGTDSAIYACGISSINMGSNTGRFQILKTDSSGNLLWNFEYSDTISMANHVIESFSSSQLDGIVACGYNNNDIQVTKVNPTNGTIIFSKVYSFGTSDIANSILQDSDGNYLVCGQTDSNCLVFKINSSNGTVIWQKKYSVQTGNVGLSIAQTGSNEFYISGSFFDTNQGVKKILVLKIDSAGSPVWSKSYTPSSVWYLDEGVKIIPTPEGNLALLSNYVITSTSFPHPLVIKIKPDGSCYKSTRLTHSQTGDNYANDLSLSNDSGLVALVTVDKYEYWLDKLTFQLDDCYGGAVLVADSNITLTDSVISASSLTSSVKNPIGTANPNVWYESYFCHDCTPMPISLSVSGYKNLCFGDSIKVSALTSIDTVKYDYYVWENVTLGLSYYSIGNTFYAKDSGEYKVTGYFGGGGGCSDTSTLRLKVTIIPKPIPQFSSLSNCYSQTIDFANQSTMGLPAKITQNVWDFGVTGITTDTSTQKNPTYTFTTLDTFNVKLVVTANNGCKDSITKSVIVPLPFAEPVAGFDTSFVTCGYDIQFEDTSSIDSGNIIFRYWNFDDPSSDGDSIGFGTSPIHKFTDTGNFNIKLIVYSDRGCVDTLIKTVYVPAINPYPLQITSLSSNWQPTGNTVYKVSNPYPAPQYGIYRWFRNGIPVFDDTCVCPTLSTKYPGTYLLQAFGDCGWENSNALELKPLCSDPLNQYFATSRNMPQGFYNDPNGYYISADIKVYNGDTVEFSATALVVDDCVKIIVEEGGTLIIDTSVVTSCGLWQGIVVQGGSSGTGFLKMTRSHLSYATLGVYAVNGGKIYMGNDTFENNYSHIGVAAGNTSAQDSTRIGKCLFGRVRRDYTTSTQICGHDDWNGTQHYVSLSGDTAFWRPLVFIDSARDVLVTQNEFALDVFYLPSPPDTVLPVNLLNERVSLFDNVTKEMIVRENEFYAIAQNQYVSKSTSDYASKFEGNILNGSGTFAVSSQLINGALFENADSMVVYNNQFHNFNRGLEMYGAGNYPDTVKDNRFENNKYGLAIAPNQWPLTANATNNTDSSLIQIQIHCNKFTYNTIAIGGSGNLQDQSGINDPDSADVGNAFTYTTDWDFIWQDNDTPLVIYYTSIDSDTPNHNVNKPIIDINSFKVSNSNFISAVQKDFGSGLSNITDNYCRAFLKTSRNNVGIEKTEVEKGEKVWVYPNPFNGHLYIRSKDELSKGQVMVFDVMGRRVLEQSITGTETEISTSHFSAGFYIIKIVEGNTIVHTQKLIKAEQ